MRRVFVLGVVAILVAVGAWMGCDAESDPPTTSPAPVDASRVGSQPPERVRRERLEAELEPPEPGVEEEAPEEPPPFEFELLGDGFPTGERLIISRIDPEDSDRAIWSWVDPEGDRELHPFASADRHVTYAREVEGRGHIAYTDELEGPDERVFGLIDPATSRAVEVARYLPSFPAHVLGRGLLGHRLDEELKTVVVEFTPFDAPQETTTLLQGSLWRRVSDLHDGATFWGLEDEPRTADPALGGTATLEREMPLVSWIYRFAESGALDALFPVDADHHETGPTCGSPTGDYIATAWGETQGDRQTFIEIRDGRSGELLQRIDRHATHDELPDLRVRWMDSRTLRYADVSSAVGGSDQSERHLQVIDLDIVTHERVGLHRAGRIGSDEAEEVVHSMTWSEPGLDTDRGDSLRIEWIDGAAELFIGQDTIPVLTIGDDAGHSHAYPPYWISPDGRHVFVGLGKHRGRTEFALVSAATRERTDYELPDFDQCWWLRDEE